MVIIVTDNLNTLENVNVKKQSDIFLEEQSAKSNLVPWHMAIIMDGNGRWAKKQNKPRTFGHYHGSDNLRNIAIHAANRGVKKLTVFAFSTENWKRDSKEVSYIFSLPEIFFKKYFDDLDRQKIRITYCGDINKIPSNAKKVLTNAIERTKHHKRMILNLALDYGSRTELVRAVKKIVENSKENNELIIDENLITSYLDCVEDVDLLVRTSGEKRISNFLLWQIAYAELYFTDLYWPEFDEKAFDDAIDNYQLRQRRFGGVIDG